MLADLGSAVLWPLLALCAAACGFLLLLTLAALAYRPRRLPSAGPRTRMAIVVPAHNEELLIGELLESLARLAYPSNRYAVHVIADNCSDATADVAQGYGVTVHIRQDAAHPGKGQALRWLLERLRGEEIDAFVFVDADSRLSENFLDVMDRRLALGDASVLQASYRVQDPASAPLVALRAMGFALMHDLRGRGKARLGLSCGLWGNGMVFTRDALDTVGWQGFSAVEDAEQHLRLLLQGERVAYVPEARVYGHMPATFGAARGQQERWEGGRRNLVARYWRPLLQATVRQRSAAPAAALVEAALPPLSALGMAALTLGIAAWVWGPPAQAALGIANLSALAAYVAVGLGLSGLPARTYVALVHVPRFVVWKLWLYVRELINRRQPAWTRTTRERLG
jgi:cellulose synthase/poly-beta-1,6-N-acetylglucosamine synthase-like glycosyltransferase